MAQVPFSVSAQVLQETQELAQGAKKFSGLTNDKIELLLTDCGVVSDKGGVHFSELFTGKKSKAHGLVNFRVALEKTDLLPPRTEAGSFESFFSNTSKLTRTTRQTDWQAEAKKVAAVNKAALKVESALHELAQAMDLPGDAKSTMHFDLLQNFYRLKTQGLADSKHSRASDQVRELGQWICQMTATSTSGWDYSSLKTGAKVVQSVSDNEDKRSVPKKIKKRKNL